MMGVKRAVPAWWLEHVEDFLRWLQRLNRRPGTIRSYRVALRDFGHYIDAKGVADLGAISRRHIEGWQDELHERLVPGTQHLDSVVLRRFLRWATDYELPVSSATLWLRVTSPRVIPGTPRPVPPADLATIMRALGSPVPVRLSEPMLRSRRGLGDQTLIWYLRTRALFWLLYTGGCRISEALSLNRDSFRGCAALLVVKGGRTHQLLISQQARDAIDDYQRARADSNEALFVSLLSPTTRLNRKDAQRGWYRLCGELGIHRRVHITSLEALVCLDDAPQGRQSPGDREAPLPPRPSDDSELCRSSDGPAPGGRGGVGHRRVRRRVVGRPDALPCVEAFRKYAKARP